MADSDSPSTELFFSKDVAGDGVHGLKLIDFDKGKLTINEEGSHILSGLPKNDNANLLFIFGNARSGKSFMMNCLVGVPGMFKVINSATPCTKGVDISSYVMKYETLAAHTKTPLPEPKEGLEQEKKSGGILSVFKRKKEEKPSGPPLMGFVDVEGQGAEDGTYDTMLALPLLMVSKIVLFNHKGAPTVTDMLSKLGVLARASDYIDLTDTVLTEDEKKGGKKRETITRRASEVGLSKKKFGHLHVLFRDFSFEGSATDVYEQLLGKEKIVKDLRSGGKNAGADPAKAAKERNDIREMLLDNFESINVWLFKQPANADDLRNYKELPPHLIDPDFSATVKQLLKKIAEQMGQPTYFHGQALTGPRLQQLIHQVAQAINEGGAVNVPSVYRAMETQVVAKTAADCIAQFDAVVQTQKKRLPIPSKELNTVLGDAFTAANTKFDDDLAECLLEDEIKSKRTEMQAAMEKLKSDSLRDNNDAILKLIKTVVTAEMQTLRDNFDGFCREKMPLQDGHELETQFRKYKEKCSAAINEKFAALPEALEMKEFKLLYIENEEVLQEYLTLKTIQNESALKDNTIQNLRNDMERQQKYLIEQNKKLEKYITDEKKTTEAMEAELKRLKNTRADEDKRNKEVADRLERQQAELEKLRKAKRACVIL